MPHKKTFPIARTFTPSSLGQQGSVPSYAGSERAAGQRTRPAYSVQISQRRAAGMRCAAGQPTERRAGTPSREAPGLAHRRMTRYARHGWPASRPPGTCIGRLSDAVDESRLVDGPFCGGDMSPPQRGAGVMTGVIAVRRARMRRGTPAEGRARGRAWLRMERFPDVGGDPRAGSIESHWPEALRCLRCEAGAAAGVTPAAAPLPIVCPDDRGPQVTWNARPARLGRRAVPCPAIPSAGNELISELMRHLRRLQRIQRRHHCR